MLAKLRPALAPGTDAIARALVRLGVTPNAVTTFGLLATLGCCAIILGGAARLGGWLLFPVLLIDLIDGAVARVSGRVTRWGGFYDATCDRVGDGAVMATLAYISREDPRLLALVLLAAISSSLVPYTRAKAEAFGCTPARGPGERPERAVVVIAGIVFDVLEPAMWVLIALTAWTAIRRTIRVRAEVDRA